MTVMMSIGWPLLRMLNLYDAQGRKNHHRKEIPRRKVIRRLPCTPTKSCVLVKRTPGGYTKLGFSINASVVISTTLPRSMSTTTRDGEDDTLS